MKPTTSKLLITKGRLIDAGGERSADVRIANGVVVEVGVGLLSGDGEQVVDASCSTCGGASFSAAWYATAIRNTQ